MTNDQFDALVAGATRTVSDLIPDRYLQRMDDNERVGLCASINNALGAILCEVIDRTGDSSAVQTRATTIAAMICELIENHIARCDEAEGGEIDRPPHVISQVHGTKANVDSIASCDVEGATQIYLVLDDGAAFRITVEAVDP